MGADGIEPSTSALSELRSTTELCAPIDLFNKPRNFHQITVVIELCLSTNNNTPEKVLFIVAIQEKKSITRPKPILLQTDLFPREHETATLLYLAS